MFKHYLESYSTKFDRPFTAYVWEAMNDGRLFPDDDYSLEEGGGYVARIGRRVIEEYSNGFVSMTSYVNETEAMKAFAFSLMELGVPIDEIPAGSPRFSSTDEALVAMFTENTGSHFLDSGGAYGRNHERNAGRDLASFMASPVVTVDGRWGLEVTLDAFHYLRERLEYAGELDALQHNVFDADGKAGSWLEMRETFIEWLAQRQEISYGIYAGEDRELESINSYNDPNLLSQTILFAMFHIDGDSYVNLQVHGGADVRGGYTAPRVFRVRDDMADLFDWSRAYLACSSCDAQWTTDDGYSFARVNDTWPPQPLTDDSWAEYGELSEVPAEAELQDYLFVREGDELPSEPVRYVRVNADGSIVCPVCRSGKLEG